MRTKLFFTLVCLVMVLSISGGCLAASSESDIGIIQSGWENNGDISLFITSDREVYYIPYEYGGFFLWCGSNLYRLKDDQLEKLVTSDNLFMEMMAMNKEQYVLRHMDFHKGNVEYGKLEWRDRKTHKVIGQMEWKKKEGEYSYWNNQLYYVVPDTYDKLYKVNYDGKTLLHDHVIDYRFYPTVFFVSTRDENDEIKLYFYTPGNDEPIISHNRELINILDEGMLYPRLIKIDNRLYYINESYELCFIDILEKEMIIQKIFPYNDAKTKGSFMIDGDLLYIVCQDGIYSYNLRSNSWAFILSLPEYITNNAPEIVVLDDNVYISVDSFFNVSQKGKLFYCNLNDPENIKTLFTIPSHKQDNLN